MMLLPNPDEEWASLERRIVSSIVEGALKGSVSSKQAFNTSSFLPMMFQEPNPEDCKDLEFLQYIESPKPLAELKEKFKNMKLETCTVVSSTRLFHMVERLLNDQLPVVSKLLAHEVNKIADRQNNTLKNKRFTNKHYKDQIANTQSIIAKYKEYLINVRKFYFDRYERYEFTIPLSLKSESGYAIGFNLLTYTVTIVDTGRIMITSRARRLTYSKHCIIRLLERRKNPSMKEVFDLIGRNMDNHSEVADSCTLLWGECFEPNEDKTSFRAVAENDKTRYEKTIFCSKEEDGIGFIPAKMLLTPAYPPPSMCANRINIDVRVRHSNIRYYVIPCNNMVHAAKYDVTFMCRTFLPESYVNTKQANLMSKLCEVYNVLDSLPYLSNGALCRSMLEQYAYIVSYFRGEEDRPGFKKPDEFSFPGMENESTRAIIAHEISNLINQINTELL